MNLDAARTYVGNLLAAWRDRRQPQPAQYEIVDTYDGILIREVGTDRYLWRCQHGATAFGSRKRPPRDARDLYRMPTLEVARHWQEEMTKREAARIAYDKVCEQQRKDRAAYEEKVIT